MVLYIARHGESEGNTRKDSGIDPKLTSTGKKQAQLLGERMKKIRLDSVLPSPLIRAVSIANETAKHQNVRTEIMAELVEVENSETREQAYKRAQYVIENIKKRFFENERVIIFFAHGTFNNYLINAAIGYPV